MNRDEAIRHIVQAIYDEGPYPEMHRAILRRHRSEWPTLWNAIDELLRTMP